MEAKGLNFTSFPLDTVHGIHSIGLEEIQYFFEPNATKKNHIPVVNLDLNADEQILFHAPLLGYNPDLHTMSLKVLAFVMQHEGPDFGIQGVNVWEKVGHQFHMQEMYAATAPVYQSLKSNPPLVNEICPCVNDIAGNGILKKLAGFAQGMRYKIHAGERKKRSELAQNAKRPPITYKGEDWEYARKRRSANKPPITYKGVEWEYARQRRSLYDYQTYAGEPWIPKEQHYAKRPPTTYKGVEWEYARKRRSAETSPNTYKGVKWDYALKKRSANKSPTTYKGVEWEYARQKRSAKNSPTTYKGVEWEYALQKRSANKSPTTYKGLEWEYARLKRSAKNSSTTYKGVEWEYARQKRSAKKSPTTYEGVKWEYALQKTIAKKSPTTYKGVEWEYARQKRSAKKSPTTYKGVEWEYAWQRKKRETNDLDDEVTEEELQFLEQQYLTSSNLSNAEKLLEANPWLPGTLEGPDQWSSFQAMLTVSMPDSQGLNHLATFLFCKLNHPQLDSPLHQTV
eukprot:GFUD01126506.1.p1 GENE.GFUD01126506.1~~GFUD01126506.1.p1  ORF type:complete len:542 (-),score=132.31 GFUD01126506.1:109-1641(-)